MRKLNDLISDCLDKYQQESRTNLKQWIRNGVPLKVQRWANGKLYIGPDTEWSTCMIMIELMPDDPIFKLVNFKGLKYQDFTPKRN